ncbi:pentatricopeptide repeat-containing protein At1g74630 [Ananas comosus]|uniref:Pentatricopeptide repeat-containing protein At1g74630 n=1 Tax=Ananas comosus TaxID=4615 RepID=A0A6P5GQS9_ANACO|nr:pentatricopeptide repeat-containing protein At1g74630 [Ananas comosus]
MNPNHHLVLQTLSLLQQCKTLDHLKRAHAHALKSGAAADPIVAGELLLRSLPAFRRMRRRSLPPDSFTFAFLSKAAANARSLSVGSQVHSLALRHGLDRHLFVATTIVSMYAECGRLGRALKVFEEMPHRNVVAWNAAVTACFRAGDVRLARKLFGEMPWRNSTSWNVMLAGHMKAGEVDFARRLFSSAPHKDAVSWSTMIAGFAAHGAFDDAIGFFKELLREGCRPNEVSLTGILSACAQAGAFETGKTLHGHAEKTGFNSIIAVSNVLLDMYARCGSVDLARQVFDWEMGKKSVISWTSMIAALAMHGHGKKAIELFDEMEQNGTTPDGVTFISVLYACSHAGLVQQGHEIFHSMADNYGLEHSIEHYGCMVDLYGRAGLLDKAYEFVMRMPMKPNAVIWRTLLGACSIHGNVCLAEHATKQLSALDPNESSDYVLLSNIYAVAGKWKDVATVRRSMSAQRINKDPGWSSIEVDKVLYTFVANEELDGEKREAEKKLAEVMARIRMEGYVPEVAGVLHDIEEEEKKEAVWRHSEKLAVAFGMARTKGAEGVIKIVKNLRVCRDCHTVMKMISKVYKREIVVRDRSRFHTFREGSCSCRDYW